MKKQDDLKERTRQFALRIIRLFSSLPKTAEAQVLGKQLLRSGKSVGANYREAYRARSNPSSSRNAAIPFGNSKNRPIG
jgi:four helix bundle protein